MEKRIGEFQTYLTAISPHISEQNVQQKWEEMLTRPDPRWEAADARIGMLAAQMEKIQSRQERLINQDVPKALADLTQYAGSWRSNRVELPGWKNQ